MTTTLTPGRCWIQQLMMPAESAHDTVAALGEVGLLQFKDLNPDKSAFQRTFANQVRDSQASKTLRIAREECAGHKLFARDGSTGCIAS